VNKQHVSFPDLEFDLATKDALLKSAKWLFNSKITNLLREQSNVDLKSYLAIAKKELEKQLNNEISKGVQLKGKVNNISVDAFYPSEKELILRAKTNGILSIEIE
jgi:purine-nucleoside phosphorylase